MFNALLRFWIGLRRIRCYYGNDNDRGSCRSVTRLCTEVKKKSYKTLCDFNTCLWYISYVCVHHCVSVCVCVCMRSPWRVCVCVFASSSPWQPPVRMLTSLLYRTAAVSLRIINNAIRRIRPSCAVWYFRSFPLDRFLHSSADIRVRPPSSCVHNPRAKEV